MIRKKIISLILTISALSVLLTGCNKNEESSPQNPVQSEESQDNSAITLPEDLTDSGENTLPVTLSFVNMCGVDIGTFSIIDPNNGEQINLMPLANKESVSIQINWPKDNFNFQWALYNSNGDLCVEATTDLSEITSSAVILVTGDGDIDNVDVTIN